MVDSKKKIYTNLKNKIMKKLISVKRGTTRTSIIFGRFVLKIPILDIVLYYLKINFRFLFLMSMREYLIYLIKYKHEKKFVQHAIYCNKIEYHFYKKQKSNYLAPVLMYFCGIILMKKMEGNFLSYNEINLLIKFIFKDNYKICQDVLDCKWGTHSIFNNKNWIDTGEGIVLVDYGDEKLTELISLYQEDFEYGMKNFKKVSI